MSMTQSLRPGVFSSYTVSARVSGGTGQSAGLCLAAGGGDPGTLFRFTSLEEASAVCSGAVFLAAVNLLLDAGIPQVIYAPAGEAADLTAYRSAFDALRAAEGVGAVVCDSVDADVQAAMLESVTAACGEQRERLGVFCADTTDRAETLAKALNHERACLCYPACAVGETQSPVLSACALAGLLLTADPAASLSGAACEGVALAGDNLPEPDVQRLMRAGVTVLETVGGTVECIRAMTSRTTTAGAVDNTFRSVSTVRIIDTVMARARAALKTLLLSGGASAQTICSQLVILLNAALDEGLLRSFDTPSAHPQEGDPSVCVVELSFEAATALNQIHIMAYVNL